MPLLLMLAAGAVTSVITYIQQYSVTKKLAILFVVLLVFWILGSVLEMTINRFEVQNEERLKAEGEVIEKEAAEEENTAAEDETGTS